MKSFRRYTSKIVSQNISANSFTANVSGNIFLENSFGKGDREHAHANVCSKRRLRRRAESRAQLLFGVFPTILPGVFPTMFSPQSAIYKNLLGSPGELVLGVRADPPPSG